MAISNTTVVDTTSKYIVKSTGIKSETDQIMVDAEKLKDGTNVLKNIKSNMLVLLKGMIHYLITIFIKMKLIKKLNMKL